MATSIYCPAIGSQMIGAALFAFAAVAGCGGSTLDKVIVQGQVTFDGTPVQNGEIRFFPAQGTKGPVSGAPIANGRFDAKAKGGVPVGSHQVQIRAFRPRQQATAAAPVAAPGDGSGPPEQYLPAKYNEQTTLTLTVSGDENPMIHNFDLTP